MALSKESKIKILEQFYGLDYIFFSKRVTKLKETCCPLLVEEYISTKGALMSVMIEYVKLIDHKPAVSEKKLKESVIFKNSRKSARFAREMAIKLLKTDKGKECVKKMVKEAVSEIKKPKKSTLEKLGEQKLIEKAHSLAVDNLLIARTLSESTSVKRLNTWEGKIIEDAYQILKDSLVEKAMEIIKGL